LHLMPIAPLHQLPSPDFNISVAVTCQHMPSTDKSLGTQRIINTELIYGHFFKLALGLKVCYIINHG
jgi:hypothetical protein